MAKIYKLTAYLIDSNDTFDESNLEDYLIWRLRDELDIEHIQLAGADLGEWDDDLPLNMYRCPKEEFEKYFKEKK